MTGQTFLVWFLPAFVSLYYLVVASEGMRRRLSVRGASAANVLIVAASVVLIASTAFGWLLLGSAALTLVLAVLLERVQTRPGAAALSRLLVGLAIVANLAALLFARVHLEGRTFVHVGVTVVTCHAIAFIVDVHRREARETTTRGPLPGLGVLTAALYLLQFPVLPAGPITRYQDINRQQDTLHRVMSLGGFTYGVRRVVMGLGKVFLLGGTLAGPVDAIFALPGARLSADAAWLAAFCFSLQLYFQFSGYADIAIGVGRMLGLRYPDNFRRPYLADSVREFWRRWNVTSITWLRDYLSLPIAGRDRPTPALVPNIVIGFCLLGLWHGAGWTVLFWAIYSSTCLALEAVVLGPRIERWPAPARHLYLLLVVSVGWVILRADTAGSAVAFLQTMAGLKGMAAWTAHRYMTVPVLTALVVAVIGAGPSVPWLSRWRVSLDAVAAGLVMMVAAVSLFVWRGGTLLLSAAPWRRRVTALKSDVSGSCPPIA